MSLGVLNISLISFGWFDHLFCHLVPCLFFSNILSKIPINLIVRVDVLFNGRNKQKRFFLYSEHLIVEVLKKIINSFRIFFWNNNQSNDELSDDMFFCYISSSSSLSSWRSNSSLTSSTSEISFSSFPKKYFCFYFCFFTTTGADPIKLFFFTNK